MNPAEMIVLLALIAVVGSLLIARQHYAFQARQRAGEVGDADASRDEVAALKARIAVLERVITDTHGTRALEAEIEELRNASAPRSRAEERR